MGKISIFLGGSIENGKARKWQEKLVAFLNKQPYADDLVIFNPRREDWDETWVNRKSNKQFTEQVTWELDHQDKSDINVYYFAKDTMSPITLLEMALYMQGKPIVGSDEGYLRLGNLEIVADRYNVNFAIGWELFLVNLDKEIERKLK